MSIKVEGLTKEFKNFVAVDNLSFEVQKNHVVGFLGPNGAGKTTTLRTIVGLSKATAGNIEVAGEKVVFGSPKSNFKLGYLPEQPSFYPWMTGAEFLNFVADVFELDSNKKAAKIDELLKLVDLELVKKKKIKTYSNGMRQRLGIAQALINDPEVIILDEPVSALDPIGRKEVLKIIEKLKKDRTVLFSTHILSDVDKICDDVVIINKGKLIASSSLPELKANYATPILEVEFEKDPEAVYKEIKKQKWVKSVEKDGTHIKIWLVDDKVINSNIPLKFLSEQKIGVLQYGLRLPEMEDLFIELIGGVDE